VPGGCGGIDTTSFPSLSTPHRGQASAARTGEGQVRCPPPLSRPLLLRRLCSLRLTSYFSRKIIDANAATQSPVTTVAMTIYSIGFSCGCGLEAGRVSTRRRPLRLDLFKELDSSAGAGIEVVHEDSCLFCRCSCHLPSSLDWWCFYATFLWPRRALEVAQHARLDVHQDFDVVIPASAQQELDDILGSR